MNANNVRYMWQDVRQGMQRNKGAALASVALIFVAMVLVGSLLLARLAMQDTIAYVESQLSMKVYIEEGFVVEEVAQVLEKNTYIEKVEIETAEVLLDRLSLFFIGKEYLLDSFSNGAMQDAVKFQVKDVQLMSQIAESLGEMKGIEKVVYPQQMAEYLASALEKIELYGLFAIIFFFVIAFMMVYIAFHLALYQREKEIRVKLLIGANPKIVRFQFLLEGLIIGLIGSVASILMVIGVYYFVFQPVSETIQFLWKMDISTFLFVLGCQLFCGLGIGLCASYLSTRKLIKNV